MKVATLLEFEMYYNYSMFCYIWGLQTGGGIFELLSKVLS